MKNILFRFFFFFSIGQTYDLFMLSLDALPLNLAIRYSWKQESIIRITWQLSTCSILTTVWKCLHGTVFARNVHYLN